MMTSSWVQWRGHASVLLEGTERAVSGAVKAVDAIADRIEMKLYAIRVSLDPEARAWSESARASIADGSAAVGSWSQDDFRRVIEDRRLARS